jgi:integrase
MAKLTARDIQTLSEPGYYGAGQVPGLYLCIAKGGSKSWIYRYQIAGRRRDMGIGSIATFTLAEARDKAFELRRGVARGVDPIDAKRQGRAAAGLDKARAMTFRECADAYITAHRAGWRSAKHAEAWPQSLEAFVYPTLGDLPVAAIDVGLVMKTLEPIWTTKPETASRVRGRIEAVLDWATARGYRKGDNPARWRGHLENLLPKRSKVARVEHHAALAYPEIATFMAELRQQDTVSARALEFAILTAARTGQVIGAGWSEINVAERLWTVPASRMKAGREHRVPLSDAAMAIVEKMAAIRQSDFVFPGLKAGQGLGERTVLKLIGRMRPEVTVHGFRSSFRDWCAEMTNFDRDTAELALAHAVGDKVEAAYRRGDMFAKRRQLMDAWAKFCDMPAVVTGGDNVRPLRKA